jgi:ribonucleoside-diphosphate reductase alpha chain
VFRDAIELANPLPELGRIQATNPCGEVPLLPYESCVLGSVNLARMLDARAQDVDWGRLARVVRLGVRFLDDVVEVSRAPLPEIERTTKASRKIGLGVMGFADMLLQLGVSYASPDAISWADRVAAFIAREAFAASCELAAERGTFAEWRRSGFAARGERVRNATRLSIAPTGTISIIAGTSGGIEPLYALAYRRHHTLGGAPLVEVNPTFARLLERRMDDRAQAIVDRVVAEGHLGRVAGVPRDVRELFVTATEITPRQHLLVQHAFQRHVDNAVSKTINLPSHATPEDVRGIYLSAWRRGLKGVTVFREGCKGRAVLVRGSEGLELGGDAPVCSPLRCD